jgi:hypothetical protein
VAAQDPARVSKILQRVGERAAARRTLRNRRRCPRLPQRQHARGQRVVAAQLLERQLPRLDLAEPLGAQRLVPVVEMLREFVFDLHLPRRRQGERRQPRAQVLRPGSPSGR